MPNQTKLTLFQTVATELSDAFESDTREPYELRAMKSAVKYLDDNDCNGGDLMSALKHAIKEAEEKADTFYKISDGASAWITGADGQSSGFKLMRAVHEAIDDRFPDDWIYAHASHVANRLTEYDDLEAARDAVGEIADDLVDVYNADRTKWLASHLGNAALVDEAMEEFGWENLKAQGVVGAIGLGQYTALARIAGALLDAIEAEMDVRLDAIEAREQ